MARKSPVKEEIYEVWDKHHDWTAGEVQAEVIKGLGEKRSKGGTYPGLRIVQKYVSEFAEHLGERVDEDKPWSVGASVRFGIPPEANRDLFDIWRASLAMGRPISIRQAKWIVHIRNLFETISTGNVYSDKVNRSLSLIRQSWLYSLLERTSRIMGEKYFDTPNLDAASFMPPWESITALKLGKIASVHYSQEALAKLEKHGTSLISPPVSVKSVEDAVWHEVRATPPQSLEFMADYTAPDDVLPEQYDLVAAYWLTHLSKGPLWNNLPEQPDIKAYEEYWLSEIRRKREVYDKAKSEGRPHMWVDSGGGPDDSLYSRQLSVRRRLLDWVKTDSIRRRLLHPVRTGSVIEQVREQMKADLPGSPPFNATLLKTVGYEVTPEQMETWLKLHKAGLLVQHKGFQSLADEIQQRFVHDEQTPDDKEVLRDVDNQAALEQERLEKELIELVERKGAAPLGKGRRELDDFWNPIIDEWNKRHPHSINWSSIPHDWRDFEGTYKALKKKYSQGNKSSNSSEGGTT